MKSLSQNKAKESYLSGNDHDLIFEKLYFENAKKVYFIAKGFYLDHQDCEEIVQEVFIKIWDNIDNIILESAGAYISTIARNTILKSLRSKAVRQNYLNNLIQNKFQSINNIDDLINYGELRKRLDSALSELSPKPRLIFELIRLKGITTSEVAEMQNLSKRTVESHLYKATKFIKEQLSIPMMLFLSWII